MKTKFYLRDVAEEGELSPKSKQRTICAYFTYHGKRVRLSTKMRVNPSDWNEKREEFRGIGNEVANKNARLKQIERKAEEIFNSLQAAGIPLEPKTLTEEIHKALFPEKYIKPAQKDNLLSFVEWYIATNPNKIKKGTMKTYMQFVPLFKELALNEGKLFLEFDSVDLDWETTFTSFLFDKSHGRNTVGRHIKNIKALMSLANRRGLHMNMKFKDFKKISEDAFSIYLTEEEITAIYNTSMPSELEGVRDVFVFSCLTGLRFSDVMALQKHNWYGDFICIETIKTEDPLKIPLRKTAKAILEKYDGNIPKFYNAKYNKLIKEIASLIPSLDVNVTFKVSKGNKKTEIVKKKYLLVQSHTARRSFATNEYARGTKTAIIMAITGHKTEKDFWKYIRKDQQEKAEDLLIDFKLRDF
ncbi:MAG: site-specific integrase [Bacteroidetes bacterium]|nr:site-specific integrase [Bacteroidota bacterium]